MTYSELTEIVEKMFLLIHTKCEITKLEVRNQNAPKYLYEQARSLQDDILQVVNEIDFRGK